MTTYSNTTRMPNGMTNAAPWQVFGDAGTPDPTWAHQYIEDFYRFAAAEWTVTLVGTGTILSIAYDGGAAQLTTTAGIADAVYIQKPFATVKLTPGKDVFFHTELLLSDVLNSVVHAGMIATSATPLAAADGVYIVKATGQAGLALVSKIGGVVTTVNFPASCLMVNNTECEIGIHIDKQGNIDAFFNPGMGANPVPVGGGRGPVARIPAASLTQVLLNQSVGILNSTAVARTLTVDFIVTSVRN